MWQVWHVGEFDASLLIFICFNSSRTPCFDDEYISHCGWSNPIWQVLHAWGDFASSVENVWRVWQESHEAFPKRTPDFASSATCSGDLSPILWQPPQPFIPAVIAIG